MDKNDENIFIERSRSGQKERYPVPKSDHQEPGSFRLLDDLFNAMHYFFRVEWSSDAYRINTNEEAIMRLCLDLKEKYKLFNLYSEKISADEKGKHHKKEFGIPDKRKRKEITNRLSEWIDGVYSNLHNANKTFWNKLKKQNEMTLIYHLALSFQKNCPDLKNPDMLYNIAKITLLCNDKKPDEIWKQDRQDRMSKEDIRILIQKEKKRIQRKISRKTESAGLPLLNISAETGLIGSEIIKEPKT
jgi:hypothetical protein